MSKTIELTPAQIKVLKEILSVDLDALGLDRKDQPAARAVLKKLRELSDAD